MAEPAIAMQEWSGITQDDPACSTLEQLCHRYDLRAEVRVGGPFNEDLPEARPWTVTLKYSRRQMSVTIYTKKEETSEPPIAEILRNVLADVISVDAVTFEGWCAEVGFNTDSRKAERLYTAAKKLGPKVKKFFGDDYDMFLAAV